jgi:cyclophilin family peptidyl-prolyl cis-trans isomerase
MEASYFTNIKFFRVIPGFICQFGLSGDPKQTAKYHESIKDDPVKHKNSKGTLTFATAGPNTRTTQLFFNFGDNSFLDSQGFSPFGEVLEGMDNLLQLTASPDGPSAPNQHLLTTQGEPYLKKSFPNLSYIAKSKVL